MDSGDLNEAAAASQLALTSGGRCWPAIATHVQHSRGLQGAFLGAFWGVAATNSSANGSQMSTSENCFAHLD